MADQLKLSKGVIRQIRKSPAVRKELHRRAEKIASAAGAGRVDGYKVTDLVLEDPRGAVSVMATGHAARHNRKHNALLRSLGAGRG